MRFFNILILVMMMSINNINAAGRDVIYLGGGCFWCVESVFSRLKGVDSAVSGYMGGTIKNPAYREVCSGTTGHAEVVKVVYDPSAISLNQILEVFFTIHDPTTLNRQGNDVGTQYRSVIFYTWDNQKVMVEKYVAELERQIVFDDPIVTQISAAVPFYEAEDYHQNYFTKNPSQPYCRIVVAPKVNKAEKLFGNLVR